MSDYSQISDIDKLKSLAYDQIAIKEDADRHIDAYTERKADAQRETTMINDRIIAVVNQSAAEAQALAQAQEVEARKAAEAQAAKDAAQVEANEKRKAARRAARRKR